MIKIDIDGKSIEKVLEEKDDKIEDLEEQLEDCDDPV